MGSRQYKKDATIQYQIDVEVAPIIYTRHQFEDRKSTIATFASDVISKNKLGGVDVSRRHVIALWILNVQNVYPVGDSKREELLNQIDSPLFHEFWATRSLAATHQDGSRAFRQAQHGPSRDEKKRYPGLIVMENDFFRVVVPRVKLLPFEQITFTDMVRWVLEANLGMMILRSDMVDLWDAIVHDIYSFECSCSQARKASESEEANSFTIEEYEQLVEEIREAETFRESLAQGVKRANPEAQTRADEEVIETDEGIIQAKRPKKNYPRRATPSGDNVLPSKESPPLAPADVPLSQNPPAEAAPSSKKPRANSQPTLKPKPELKSQQESGKIGQQGARISGSKPTRVDEKERADVTRGSRMMQIKRGTSANRRGGGSYLYDKPEL